MMSQKHTDSDDADTDDMDNLEKLLVEGVSLDQPIASLAPSTPQALPVSSTPSRDEEDDDEDSDVPTGGDLQGAIGLFAEAAQDMATAGVELGLGRHFACADYCNQVAEKALQAVSLLNTGRRSPYDHNLRSLGERVGAPAPLLYDLEKLTPFHPEAFYADTPPEEADEIISAGQASDYLISARRVLRWARGIIL